MAKGKHCDWNNKTNKSLRFLFTISGLGLHFNVPKWCFKIPGQPESFLQHINYFTKSNQISFCITFNNLKHTKFYFENYWIFLILPQKVFSLRKLCNPSPIPPPPTSLGCLVGIRHKSQEAEPHMLQPLYRTTPKVRTESESYPFQSTKRNKNQPFSTILQ